jgi:PhnB protein
MKMTDSVIGNGHEKRRRKSMRLNTYLSFNGQCEAAFKFYERVLGGKITFMTTWGESPMAKEVAPEMHDRIMHATVTVGNFLLMGADSPPDQYEQPKGISLTLHYEDTAEARRIFDALAENGSVQMPFQKTFWAEGFGMCVDQFNIPWMINSGE